MFSDRGEAVTQAEPATPVEILGLQGVPQAGDTFQVVSDVERAQTIAGQRQMYARQAAMLKTTKRGIESLGQAEIKELLVILKADVQGSVEVLRGRSKNFRRKVKVRVQCRVGAIASQVCSVGDPGRRYIEAVVIMALCADRGVWPTSPP